MPQSRMMTPRRWIIAPADARAKELADKLKTSVVVAQILLNRGVTEIDDCTTFLRPNLKGLLDPQDIPGLTAGAQRIARAIKDHEKIVIYGDYDVDGITGVAILWHSIKRLGGNVAYYIPHRVDEGYGLNPAAITQLCDEGAKLIVTVDCGVTAIEPIAVARARGVDVVVSDHHEWKTNDDGSPKLPEANAVVHPRLPGTTYANGNLCGAGVAFKLAWGTGQAISGQAKVCDALKAFLVEAMALAALGTIADVVPLVGENRILAYYGLGGLKQTKITGLLALIESADLDGKNIDSYHVGFLLAPRLNAAGRMGHAALAAEMLTNASPERALEIAEYLEQQNRTRQATERAILEQAIAQIGTLNLIEQDQRAIVVGAAGWHPGVIGIVASRIVDRFHRPAVVVGLGDEIGQGSGRSIDGFHLSQALEKVSHTLVSHGGHEMAAGLKVLPSRFEEFREAFAAHANSALEPAALVPELKLDCCVPLSQMCEALISDLDRLGPFGRGNPRPVLRCENLSLTAPPRRVGKTGDHLQLFLKQNGTTMKAIAFGAGNWGDKLTAGSVIHIAVQPQMNEYNGCRSVELQVKDLQLANDE